MNQAAPEWRHSFLRKPGRNCPGFAPRTFNCCEGRIARRALTAGAEGLQECHQRGRFRWRKVLPVRRHVTAALQHLPDQLVWRQPNRHGIETWAALAALAAETVAVAALFRLKHDCALTFECGTTLKIFRRHRHAAPGV